MAGEKDGEQASQTQRAGLFTVLYTRHHAGFQPARDRPSHPPLRPHVQRARRC
jgi:hypothetical protein